MVQWWLCHLFGVQDDCGEIGDARELRVRSMLNEHVMVAVVSRHDR
jgi:hypothetical protein